METIKKVRTLNEFEKRILKYMKSKKVNKKKLTIELGVSYETLETRFKNPLRFTGFERQKIADALTLPVEIIDGIINNAK